MGKHKTYKTEMRRMHCFICGGPLQLDVSTIFPACRVCRGIRNKFEIIGTNDQACDHLIDEVDEFFHGKKYSLKELLEYAPDGGLHGAIIRHNKIVYHVHGQRLMRGEK
jgi:hypothetical protein